MWGGVSYVRHAADKEMACHREGGRPVIFGVLYSTRRCRTTLNLVIGMCNAVYRAGKLVGWYRLWSARFHVGMAHLLDRWATWHSRMAKLIVDDAIGRSGGW